MQRILSSLMVIGAVFSVQAGAEPMVEGQVRLASGEPVAGAHVRLFDLRDLRSWVGTTTDETGSFALPVAALPGATVQPQQFNLGENYPNPFNPSTVIPYHLQQPMLVRLEVFNVLGQHVATLVDGEQSEGFHTARWDGTDESGQAVAAGMYLYRLSGEGVQITRSMVLIDGQAGVPAGSSGRMPQAGAEATEVSSVYGLTVSGPGLIPFVDPAFQVGSGPVAVELVEASASMARAKTTDEHESLAEVCSAAGVLGDVDNNSRVDFFDAVLVALYSKEPSTIMPNNGDISLGDVNADGRIDFTDAYLIAGWLDDPSDPTVPAGIGQGGGGGASLDCATLVALYEATDGDNWTNNTHWLSGQPLGEWFGVRTNDVGRVISLELYDNGLSGVLPSESGDLINLEWLDLYDNELSGVLPSSLSALTHLERLDLRNTRLCAPTDDVFQTWLEGIDNKHGVINCGDVLSFADAAIADQAFTAGTAITPLVLPPASGGTGDLTYSVSDLPAGLTFDAATRTISGTPTAATDGAVEVTYTATDSVGATVTLTFSITVNEMLVFGDWVELPVMSDSGEWVLVVGEPIAIPLPPAYGGTPPLTYSLPGLPAGLAFDADTRTISGTPTAEGATVVTYTATDANGASASVPIPITVITEADPDRDALVALYEATDGDNWENNTNWLSDRPINEWFGVTTNDDGRVTWIELGRNELSGVLPSELGNLDHLQALDLSANDLSGALPAALGNLNNLQGLDLSTNDLSGALPAALGNLNNLQELYLDGNQFSGTLPAALGNLNNLQWLYLDENQFSGALPAELGNLTSLQGLYLHGNQFSGALPAELGNLTSLQWLYLQGNQFSGALPAKLVNLTNLQSLWLQRTQLCAPTDIAFQMWLQGIDNKRGVSIAKKTPATQRPTRTAMCWWRCMRRRMATTGRITPTGSATGRWTSGMV